MSDKVEYMQRCLQLAAHGVYTTAPNPMVGCVIVHQNRIVGEGWHQKAGEPHAEVVAINSVKNHEILPECTLYVNLEPCAHHGRTPPCASLIVQKKIPRVVVACTDPNPLVAGNGIKLLQENGVVVELGVLQNEALALNRKFIVYHHQKRPYITLKWAQTADGFMDKLRTTGETGSFAISGPQAAVWVHQQRAKHMGILIGANTVSIDNPKLTVRHVPGSNPVRLVLDPKNRTPKTAKIFVDGNETWQFVAHQNVDNKAQQICISSADFLHESINEMYKRGMQSVLVEGGAQTLKHFLAANLWDEVYVLIAQKTLGSGLPAPQLPTGIMHQNQLGNDKHLTIYRNGLPGSGHT